VESAHTPFPRRRFSAQGVRGRGALPTRPNRLRALPHIAPDIVVATALLLVHPPLILRAALAFEISRFRRPGGSHTRQLSLSNLLPRIFLLHSSLVHASLWFTLLPSPQPSPPPLFFPQTPSKPKKTKVEHKQNKNQNRIDKKKLTGHPSQPPPPPQPVSHDHRPAPTPRTRRLPCCRGTWP